MPDNAMREERFADGKAQFRMSPTEDWQDMPAEMLWNLYREATKTAIEYKIEADISRRRLLSRTL